MIGRRKEEILKVKQVIKVDIVYHSQAMVQLWLLVHGEMMGMEVIAVTSGSSASSMMFGLRKEETLKVKMRLIIVE